VRELGGLCGKNKAINEQTGPHGKKIPKGFFAREGMRRGERMLPLYRRGERNREEAL